MRVYSLLLFVFTIHGITEQAVVCGILILGVLVIYLRLIYRNQLIVLEFLLLIAVVRIVLI